MGRRRSRQGAHRPTVAPVVSGGLPGGRYRPLSEAEVERIVAAAIEVLGRTGIELVDSPCRQVLLAAGCTVEADSNRLTFPPALIEQGLAAAAGEVVLAGREAGHDMIIGGNRVYMGTGGSAINILDLKGRLRPTRLADNYHIGRLVDRLEHVHFYMRPVVSRDIPAQDLDLNQFYACLAATPKHVMANAYQPENVARLRQMGDILAGGSEAFEARPTLSLVACWTVSPLRYAEDTVTVVEAAVEQGIPLVLSSAPQAGATAPAALAGTLVQLWAEQLSGIVYVNLLRPGFPLIAGCVPAQADLRSGSYTGGSAEASVMNAACAQIAQHLDLPLYNSAGIVEAKAIDSQAGIEKVVTSLAAGLAGANFIHHSAGFLESMLTVAYEQYVIDNEVNGQVMRLVRGIEVSDETLSVDVIDAVCRGEGHFLGHPQTRALMHTEYLYPALLDRADRTDWQAAGARELHEVARERARQLLDEHWPEVIPPDQDDELRRHFNILLPRSEMQPPAG